MRTVIGVHAGLSVDHLVVEPIGARFAQLGGPGLFATLGAATVGDVTVRLTCGLPADDNRFSELLMDRGVDLAHTSVVPTVPHVWILNSTDGRRVVNAAPVDGMELDAAVAAEPPSEEPDRAFYEGLDGLLVSAPQGPIPRRAQTTGIDPDQFRLAVDSSRHLAELLAPGDLVLPSRVQLGQLGPGEDPRVVAMGIADRFGVAVVARLDADGMFVVDGTDRWDLRDPDVEVIETTGAGDASAGAIVAARAAGRDLPEAAAFGISVARLALSGWGHTGLIGPPLTDPFSTIRITRRT